MTVLPARKVGRRRARNRVLYTQTRYFFWGVRLLPHNTDNVWGIVTGKLSAATRYDHFSGTTLSSGESESAVPRDHRSCSRVSHIWGNRRGQHIRRAMSVVQWDEDVD